MTKQELQDKFDEIIDALPDDAYIVGIIDTAENRGFVSRSKQVRDILFNNKII